MKRMLFLSLFLCAASAAADEVVWYTAMNVPDVEALRKPFNARHPSIQLSVMRATGEKVRTRILTEARAGRHAWDVVSFNLLDMDALNREGLLAPYVSPETKSGYPAGAIGRNWAAIYVRQYVIGYNTQLVKDPPRAWSDLLEPRWAGKLALDETDVEWYAAMLDYWGREKGTAFMQALSRQKPQQRRGHNLLTRLLVAGEFPLALIHAAEVEKEKQDGAPIDWVKTLDPIITSPSQVAISAKAPHAKEAQLLVDFLLSKEGQRAIEARGRVPARADLGSTRGELKVHYVSAKLAPRFNEHERDFRAIFGRAQ